MEEEQKKTPENVTKPNRIVSIFRTLRNNWKKSTFGFVLLGFGCNYAAERYRTNLFMRTCCEEARKYGEQTIPVSVKPRHVTVILNPAAKNRKGKALYEKFSSPLLYLSGVKVSVILTEEEGQARSLMEVMDNTDAVVIAGGDGTLHEAVTGLLRREDQASACKRFPIGLAPIGKKNLFAKSLFPDLELTDERLLAETTMAVIRELHEPIDVMKVEGSSGKPVYTVKSLECGAFRDTDTTIEKYWYFGALKSKVAYLRAAIKSLPENLSLNLSYTLPCSGCRNCYRPDPQSLKERESHGSKWWHAFIPRAPAAHQTVDCHEPDYSKVVNENCGLVHHKNVSCSNLLFTIHNENAVKAIKGDFENPLSGRFNFLWAGWKRHSSNPEQPEESVQFKEAEITFEAENDEDRWFSMDNEKYEKRNVKISLLPSKVHMYVQKKLNI